MRGDGVGASRGPQSSGARGPWFRRPVWLAVIAVGVITVGGAGWIFAATSDDDECTATTTSVYPGGSCAPVFTAVDANAKGVVVTAFATRSEDRLDVRYRFRNETMTLRSLDWRLVTASAPNGDRVDCWGDDSAYRYEAPPGRDVESYGTCEFAFSAGQYEVFYDGVAVAAVTVP